MPYRRRVRRRYRRKPRYNRRMGRRRFRRGPPSTLLGNKQLVKFKYSDIVSLTQTLPGVMVSHTFSANGLTDPDITGVGHQPSGFDQLTALYDHYVVIASKITVRAAEDTADTQEPSILTVALSDTEIFAGDLRVICESAYVKTKQISPGIGFPTTISMKANVNKFLGRSKPLSDPQLKGTNAIGGNPAEQAYWIISTESMSSLATTGTIRVHVIIEYWAVLIEPKRPGIS